MCHQSATGFRINNSKSSCLKGIFSDKMNLLKFVYSFIVILLMVFVNADSLKVIFAKNTSAADINIIESETKVEEIDKSTIINVSANCKPGYIFEAKRCRRIAS